MIQLPQPAPDDQPPVPGAMHVVADGIRWLRLALPFRLDHVNVYLLDDGDGTTLVDTGIFDAPTCAVWERLLPALAAEGRPVHRIIATHCHPDHLGMAGWIAERTGAPLLMSTSEYLTSLAIHLDPSALEAEPYATFYASHGLDPAVTARLLHNGHHYLRMVSPLPRTFRRVVAGEQLTIGARRWQILTGGGHAPEQVMLHCPEDDLLLCADQVLLRISPNISVQAMDPQGDPLGIYLRSLASLRALIPDTTLLLPGHNLPFRGLRARVDELTAHHAGRLAAILEACRDRPTTAAALILTVFGRTIDDPHQMGFAFGEALAHANLLVRREQLRLRAGRFEPV